MLSETDWSALVATFGFPGAALVVLIATAIKSPLFKSSNAASSTEVLEAIERVNEKLDNMKLDVADRLARIETTQTEHGRRITRIE